MLDEAQEAELAASIEGVSALSGSLVGSANTGRRARMKAAAEDDAAELQVIILRLLIISARGTPPPSTEAIYPYSHICTAGENDR